MPAQVFELRTQRLGPLPLTNHYIDRLGLPALLDRFVPTSQPRTRLRYGTALGILLRSLLTEREPLYRLGEVVHTFAPEGFGLSEAEAARVSDDAIALWTSSSTRTCWPRSASRARSRSSPLPG